MGELLNKDIEIIDETELLQQKALGQQKDF